MADADNGGSTKGWLDRIFKLFNREPQNEKQLLELLKNLQSHQFIGADELTMIEGVLQVDDMQVRDIMIPRGQMVVLDHEDSFPEIIEKITACGHSRFPVIDDDKDDVVGILLAKDLLQLSLDQSQEFEINEYIRPASFIPESKRLNVLLKEFRLNRSHMAMIVDEYGGVSGLITIEDVLEQIVGKIDDEHDEDDAQWEDMVYQRRRRNRPCDGPAHHAPEGPQLHSGNEQRYGLAPSHSSAWPFVPCDEPEWQGNSLSRVAGHRPYGTARAGGNRLRCR